MHNNVHETAKILSKVDLISDLLLLPRAAPLLKLRRLLQHILCMITEYSAQMSNICFVK